MPELANMSVGSFGGINGLELIILCSFFLKKFLKVSLVSFNVFFIDKIITTFNVYV